jgi:peptidoglycan/xylan/chitin deacetylase (PgdA/CDA1 family)
MLVKNFLFHRVEEPSDRLWPAMRPALFESIIRFLTRNYQIVNLEDFMNGHESKNLSSKPVSTILFDDGYKDNIEYAVPILKKYSCPASFYIVTGCIDQNIPTWTFIVDHLFQQTQLRKLELEMDFVPHAFKVIQWKDLPERLAAGARLKPWMKSLSNDERYQVLDRLQRTFVDVELPRDKMMNWDDLRQIQSAGFTVGSHSVSHPLLASIKKEEELFFELKESGNRIATELGKFPETISYPVGSYDSRVILSAKKAGYKMGLAVRQQFYETNKDDLFSVPRVELYNEPMWKCKLRINGVYSWLKKQISS